MHYENTLKINKNDAAGLQKPLSSIYSALILISDDVSSVTPASSIMLREKPWGFIAVWFTSLLQEAFFFHSLVAP